MSFSYTLCKKQGTEGTPQKLFFWVDYEAGLFSVREDNEDFPVSVETFPPTCPAHPVNGGKEIELTCGDGCLGFDQLIITITIHHYNSVSASYYYSNVDDKSESAIYSYGNW
jgi:hypothetical protein